MGRLQCSIYPENIFFNIIHNFGWDLAPEWVHSTKIINGVSYTWAFGMGWVLTDDSGLVTVSLGCSLIDGVLHYGDSIDYDQVDFEYLLDDFDLPVIDGRK